MLDQLDNDVVAGYYGSEMMRLAQTVFWSWSEIHASSISLDMWLSYRTTYRREMLLILRAQAVALGRLGNLPWYDSELAKLE